VPDYTVIRVQTVLDPNPARAGQPATLITFQVQPGGAIRSTFLPGQNPTEQQVRDAISAADRSATSVEGKRFTV